MPRPRKSDSRWEGHQHFALSLVLTRNRSIVFGLPTRLLPPRPLAVAPVGRGVAAETTGAAPTGVGVARRRQQKAGGNRTGRRRAPPEPQTRHGRVAGVAKRGMVTRFGWSERHHQTAASTTAPS